MVGRLRDLFKKTRREDGATGYQWSGRRVIEFTRGEV